MPTRTAASKAPRHRVDHGMICGRTCANSGHYKPLCACVDRTFINPNSSGRRPEKFGACAGPPMATRKMRAKKPSKFSTYETYPPPENTSDLADFHQRQGRTRRFAGKGREIEL